ncbi:MAG: SdrD B-like domain-containing protein [Caldilineaceae bacterium]
MLPGNSLAAQSAYELRISLTDPNLPALAQPTLANATFLGDGNDDLRDADGDSGERNPGFSTIVVTTGSNGVNDHTYDFGFYVPAVAIGNLVWLDNGAGGGTAGDGAINGDEQGIAGVPVELYAGTVASGTPLFAMTTNADGFYLFDRLPPNDYVVHIPATAFVPGAPLYDSALATPYRSSQPNGADTADDDNRDENGQNRPPAILTTSGISSTVVNLAVGAEPIDEAGRQDATQSILPDANVNLTVDFAFWSPPRYSVGNRVWLDDGSTGGANTGVANNGIQDGMEPGIGAVAVELRSSSDAVISTTVTDDNGYYRFDDLLPGAYQVVLPSINFSGTAPLAGLMSSSGAVTTTTNTVDQRDNGIDAVGPAATGIRSALFILPLPSGNPLAEPDVTASGRGAHGPAGDGNDNLVIDFGFVPVPELVAVGNMVWLDDGAGNGVRGDGIINGTEAGIAGVELQLFADAIITGTPLQTTTTMTDGRYLFANLQPGRYGIHIPGSQFAPGGPLYDTINNRPIPSSPPEGGDTPNDDNTDENGQNTLPNDLMQLGVSSTVFALQPNSEPTGEAGVAGPTQPPG